MNLNYIKNQLDKLVIKKDIKNVRDLLTDSDIELVNKKANELYDNTFTFDKPWDMERCIIPYQLDVIDWNVQKNDDEEWCFMLNRMDYINYLILSKDCKYHLKAKELIIDWILKHPEIKVEPSTRTLDTGIRMMNIFEALIYLYADNLINDEELVLIATSLINQAQYLKEHYLKKYITSNWGSIQTCALVSVLPYISEDSEVYRWAKNELDVQMACQVYDDGMHWEQSTMYHIEVLNYGMKALFYNEDINNDTKEQIYKLALSLFYQATPSKEIETFGDSDRSNIQDVFTRASIIFDNPIFKFMGFEVMDLESLYTLGANNANKYKSMEVIKPKRLVYDGFDSGMYVSRSSFEKDANFMMFTNGSLGSGHGHSDNLHVSIYFKGKPISIDAGRLTYREDHPLRVELKSMKAHNGIIIDNHESSKPSDSWGYSDFSIPLKNYVYHKDDIHYYEGTLIGHDPLQVWTRKVLFIDKGIWLIVDEVKEDGNHNMVTRFHLDPRKDVLDDIKIISNQDLKITDEICSLRYNEELHHQVYNYSIDFKDNVNTNTVFMDKQFEVLDLDVFQDGDKKMSEDIVTGKKFIISEDEYYAVAIFHKEIFKGKKILFLDDEPFHAKVFVIHKEKDKVKRYLVRA